MYQKYIDKLEFNKILDILSSFCNTNVGKEMAVTLHPSTNTNMVFSLLKQTTEATSLIIKKHSPDFTNVSDITNIVKILEGNGTLNVSSLIEVTKILKLSSYLKNYYYDDENSSKDFPILDEYFSSLYVNPSICQTLQKSILDEFTIADDASSRVTKNPQKTKKTRRNYKR